MPPASDIILGRIEVKTLLVAAMAASTVAAGAVLPAAPAEAAAVKVVIKPGYPYYYRGTHYRYRYSGRYYNRRVYKCVWKHHRKVCKYRYW